MNKISEKAITLAEEKLKERLSKKNIPKMEHSQFIRGKKFEPTKEKYYGKNAVSMTETHEYKSLPDRVNLLLRMGELKRAERLAEYGIYDPEYDVKEMNHNPLRSITDLAQASQKVRDIEEKIEQVRQKAAKSEKTESGESSTTPPPGRGGAEPEGAKPSDGNASSPDIPEKKQKA